MAQQDQTSELFWEERARPRAWRRHTFNLLSQLLAYFIKLGNEFDNLLIQKPKPRFGLLFHPVASVHRH